MRTPWLCLTASFAAVLVTTAFGCSSDEGTPATAGGGAGGSAGSAAQGGKAGAGGTSAAAGSTLTAGSGGIAGSAGTAGSAVTGGAGGDFGGDAGSAGDAAGGVPAGDCGDPAKEGVIVFDDITQETTWNCPVYTLTKPIFVHSTTDARTVLHIAAGVTIKGIEGNLDLAKLPGALIITRTGTLDATGTAAKPIVFTSNKPPAERTPGSWGGVVMLGYAQTNAPANYKTSGNVAGQMFIEGLPKTTFTTYGAPFPQAAGGAGGAGGAGPSVEGADPEWNCGTLKYARIEYAGFEVAPGNELNGLTLGGCGRGTQIDFVQVHDSSDDGIEIFGGTVNLKHIVLTGEKDDGLDWDEGWSGRAQFVAIQMHDDTGAAANQIGDSCIEADGWATPLSPLSTPSSPRIFNLTMIASKSSTHGALLRDGTQAYIGNAIMVAGAAAPAKGLIEIDGAPTANFITAGKLKVEHAILSGKWPAQGEKDSNGTTYTEADYFTTGAGSVGNSEIAAATDILQNAFNESKPGWVPALASAAADNASAPSDPDSAFFDALATYRGAFKPGGADWTAGWTAYP